MSELDRDWIQRDLDGGAIWEDGVVPLDLVSELRSSRHAFVDEVEFTEHEAPAH